MNGRWWQDPVEARRIARWSLIGICVLGGYAAVGPLGGLVAFLLVPIILVAVAFEARGALFFLQFAHLRPPGRRRIPAWLPSFGMLVGGIALVIVGSSLGGAIGNHINVGIGQALTGAAIAGAAALFFAGLFTLLGYWIDKELSGWVERQAEDDVPEQFREQFPNQRGRGRRFRNRNDKS